MKLFIFIGTVILFYFFQGKFQSQVREWRWIEARDDMEGLLECFRVFKDFLKKNSTNLFKFSKKSAKISIIFAEYESFENFK